MSEVAFHHQNRTLVARSTNSANGVTVRVYEADQEATTVTYSATSDDVADATKGQSFFSDLEKELLELARGDVESGRVPLLPSKSKPARR